MSGKRSSPIESLPPEVFSRIFALLSCQKPLVDIANSRLVCKAFKDLSSPYLLTTVVIAERVEAFRKLREVMDHEYFRKHVTHLIWDASYWKTEHAAHGLAYSMEASSHPAGLHFEKLFDNDEKDFDAFNDLLRYDARENQAERGLVHLSALPGDGIDFPAHSTILSANAGLRGEQLRTNVYEGLALYSRRLHQQRRSQNLHLAWRYLHLCFLQFPKLQHLSYTNYCALSRHDESYGRFCERMFGLTIPPVGLSVDERPGHEGVAFTRFLRELSQINPPLRSFSIGQTNFDPPGRLATEEHDHEIRSFDPGAFIPYVAELEPMKGLFATVRSLRLPVYARELRSEEDGLPSIISPATQLLKNATSLTHLGLATSKYNICTFFFSRIVNPLHFEHLRSIEIRGWTFRLSELEVFLFRHHDQLRHLHLIDCKCEDSYTLFLERVRREWPQRLSLEGVEIVGLSFASQANELHDGGFGDHICIYNVEIVDVGKETDAPTDVEQHFLSQCPARRTELECAILGSRGNNSSRQTHCGPPGPYQGRWWKLPVCFH